MEIKMNSTGHTTLDNNNRDSEHLHSVTMCQALYYMLYIFFNLQNDYIK